MNIELKPLQVEFHSKEIIIRFPSWYQTSVGKIKIIASQDIQPIHYGVAEKEGILYVLLSQEDTEAKQVHVSVENPQIEHISPDHLID